MRSNFFPFQVIIIYIICESSVIDEYILLISQIF